MKDQAERLREIVKKSKVNNYINKVNEKESKTRVLAITSGKGGVGKTNFTINLAISLSNLGYKVIVFDADIGLANIDIILGMIPKYTIANVINGSKDILDVIVEGPNGIKVIAGGSGIRELTELSEEQLNKLIYQLGKLEGQADFILIDTGAGLSKTVLNFVSAANEVVFVTTPEPTALTDVYALIKTLTLKGIQRNLNIVINNVEDGKEAYEVFMKLDKAVKRFLKTNINELGYITQSKLVGESVKNQKPYTLLYPDAPISKRINTIALNILGNNIDTVEKTGLKSFISKLHGLFSKGGNT